jgi:hypothetical protein
MREQGVDGRGVAWAERDVPLRPRHGVPVLAQRLESVGARGAPRGARADHVQRALQRGGGVAVLLAHHHVCQRPHRARAVRLGLTRVLRHDARALAVAGREPALGGDREEHRFHRRARLLCDGFEDAWRPGLGVGRRRQPQRGGRPARLHRHGIPELREE